MNKDKFIHQLSEIINYSIEECNRINEILESNFVLSKKSKDTIVSKLINEFKINEEEANDIYTISVKLITKEIKNATFYKGDAY